MTGFRWMSHKLTFSAASSPKSAHRVRKHAVDIDHVHDDIVPLVIHATYLLCNSGLRIRHPGDPTIFVGAPPLDQPCTDCMPCARRHSLCCMASASVAPFAAQPSPAPSTMSLWRLVPAPRKRASGARSAQVARMARGLHRPGETGVARTARARAWAACGGARRSGKTPRHRPRPAVCASLRAGSGDGPASLQPRWQ